MLDVTEELVVKGGSITPYLLLLALSLHGFFEGVALGVQSSLSGVLKLVFAILAHKWAEAFTLVIIKYYIKYYYLISFYFNN